MAATATATATEKQYIEIAAVTAIKIANPTKILTKTATTIPQ